MGYRISIKDLENRIEYLNYLNGFENVKYDTIGAYFLGGAYGGYCLEQRANKQGGVNRLTSYVPRKELYNFINGMIAQINQQRIVKKPSKKAYLPSCYHLCK